MTIMKPAPSVPMDAVKRVILVGNFPPRKCGIATFTEDLLNNLRLLVPDIRLSVCAMNESVLDTHAYPAEVMFQIEQDDEQSYIRAAESINRYADETIVIVQHEYGIYGGNSGDFLLGFLRTLLCPVMTTFHTVVAEPSQEMRHVTEQIIDRSDRLIVLTDGSFTLLNTLYPAANGKVVRIMHGIHPLLYKQPIDKKAQFDLQDRKVLLTFGLLSRNKGIEYIISALPNIIKQMPDVIYLVLGATHPGVLRSEGETYRLELMKLVKDLSLQNHVRFIDDFLPVKDILEYLQAADVYIATSLDPQQAVSGTLSYALGAGRAVIATSFAQAKEIVSPQVGRIVPIGDSPAVSDAVLELFADPEQLLAMNHAAFAQTRSMLWTNTADEYASCLAMVANEHQMVFHQWPALNWTHIEELTDNYGMFQFAQGTQPDIISGYTLDDNSRALQVVYQASQAGLIGKNKCEKLAHVYISVIDACLSELPAVNYIAADTRHPTEQNLTEDLSDSMARAYYALQTIICNGSPAISKQARDIASKLPSAAHLSTHIRSIAQLLLGATMALEHGDESSHAAVDTFAHTLMNAFHKNSTEQWRWFDVTMTYANGQLSSSLLEAARVTGSDEYRQVGLESLEFLMQSCFMGDIYAPIGQNGWHNRDGTRALFDQQPEDTFSMMQALESAHKLTGSEQYAKRAAKVFSWFMGNNLIGVRIYDDMSGGGHDGLTPSGINQNEGAESTIAYLSARLTVERLRAKD